jgi:hypothetical protein
MKKHLKYILLAALALSAERAVAQEIEYSYDNAGNRIQRKVLVQRSSDDANPDAVEGPIADSRGEFSFLLYPNPTEGEIRIDAEPEFMALEGKRLTVYDMNGRQVKEGAFDEQQRSIDLTGQQSGSYIVRLTAANGYSIEWRVVKQ